MLLCEDAARAARLANAEPSDNSIVGSWHLVANPCDHRIGGRHDSGQARLHSSRFVRLNRQEMDRDMVENRKARPRRIVVFGASGHLGGPLARHVQAQAPDVHLRLVTSAPSKLAALADAFPQAEMVQADYFDEASMRAALSDANGVFLVTPNFLDEARAMPIFVRAARDAGTIEHVVRLLGDPPGMTLDRVPASIREFWPAGPATQHLIAKDILKQSDLPVTFMNCAAYLMDNLKAAPLRGLQEHRTLIVPVNRINAFIDPRDVAEVAACLLLSENHRHIGQTHHLDNGHDLMRFSQVAELMSDLFGEPIAYDGSPETFMRVSGERYRRIMGNERAPDYMVDVFEYERENEVVWRRSDVVESIIGRKPRTLRDWLGEHRDILLGDARPAVA
jgi:uncharacterized protein YbjT (DUF2867 family)